MSAPSDSPRALIRYTLVGLALTVGICGAPWEVGGLLTREIRQRQVGISPVFVIIALLIGGSLLGVLGAILAVPAAAILQVLFQELVTDATAE